MYKKGAGNDKQGKDAGNRTLCPYRNFSQAIIHFIDWDKFPNSIKCWHFKVEAGKHSLQGNFMVKTVKLWFEKFQEVFFSHSLFF